MAAVAAFEKVDGVLRAPPSRHGQFRLCGVGAPAPAKVFVAAIDTNSRYACVGNPERAVTAGGSVPGARDSSYSFAVAYAVTHATLGREHIAATSEALIGGDVGDSATGGRSTGAAGDPPSSTRVAVHAATTTKT